MPPAPIGCATSKRSSTTAPGRNAPASGCCARRASATASSSERAFTCALSCLFSDSTSPAWVTISATCSSTRRSRLEARSSILLSMSIEAKRKYAQMIVTKESAVTMFTTSKGSAMGAQPGCIGTSAKT